MLLKKSEFEPALHNPRALNMQSRPLKNRCQNCECYKTETGTHKVDLYND